MVIYDKTQKDLVIPNAFIKSVEGGSAVAGVKSINGLTGDLSIKTINDESILEEGNLNLTTAWENRFVTDRTIILSASQGYGGLFKIDKGKSYQIITAGHLLMEEPNESYAWLYINGYSNETRFKFGDFLDTSKIDYISHPASSYILIHEGNRVYQPISDIYEMNDDDIEDLKAIFDEPVPPEPVPPYYYIVNPIGELE